MHDTTQPVAASRSAARSGASAVRRARRVGGGCDALHGAPTSVAAAYARA